MIVYYVYDVYIVHGHNNYTNNVNSSNLLSNILTSHTYLWSYPQTVEVEEWFSHNVPNLGIKRNNDEEIILKPRLLMSTNNAPVHGACVWAVFSVSAHHTRILAHAQIILTDVNMHETRKCVDENKNDLRTVNHETTCWRSFRTEKEKKRKADKLISTIKAKQSNKQWIKYVINKMK